MLPDFFSDGTGTKLTVKRRQQRNHFAEENGNTAIFYVSWLDRTSLAPLFGTIWQDWRSDLHRKEAVVYTESYSSQDSLQQQHKALLGLKNQKDPLI